MSEFTDLPAEARARLDEARSRGTWTSDLSVNEFAAIRSVGFEPVGQVMGSAVYNIAVYRTFGDCGWRRAPFVGVAARTVTSGERGYRDNGYSGYVAGRYAARRAAMGRMAAECTALGGHGVVAVRLTVESFAAGSATLEFQAIGTAIRAAGVPPPPRPFLSHLSGQDFAKLMEAHWVPVDMALGISVGLRHDDARTRWSSALMAGPQEVEGWTELLAKTRAEARRDFFADAARAGATGLLVSNTELRIWERECSQLEGNRDHVVESMFLGTSIAPFESSGTHRRSGALAIMSLDRDRRTRL